MPSLDSLPGDQRAVLQLVLGRGRSYDEIARMLSINPSSVRERALAALRALGPQTTVSDERQAMISDYLLGQLSDQDAGRVRNLLADSPSDRAWARVLSSELAPLATGPMPEIPVQSEPPEPVTPAEAQAGLGAEPEAPQQPAPAPAASPAAAPRRVSEPSADEESEPAQKGRRRRRREAAEAASLGEAAPRSSRVGGALLIAAGVVVVAAVVFLLVRGGGSSKQPTATSPSTPAASASASTSTASATTTTTSTSSTAKVVAQINLSPPTSTKAGTKTAGIAEILNEGSANGVAIVAQNVPANTTRPPNAYAVWLYNSPTDAQILGFVNPGVGKTGRLSTAGGLPSNAKHFKNLIVTLETTAKPKTPGTIILEGPLSGL